MFNDKELKLIVHSIFWYIEDLKKELVIYFDNMDHTDEYHQLQYESMKSELQDYKDLLNELKRKHELELNQSN